MLLLLTLKRALFSLFLPSHAADNLSLLENTPRFDQIPIELQQLIYSYLTYEDLVHTSHVSKHHHRLTQEQCQLIYNRPEHLALLLSPSMLLKPFPVYHLKSIEDIMHLTGVSSWTEGRLRSLTPFKEIAFLLFNGSSEDDHNEKVDFNCLSYVLKELPKIEQLACHCLQLTTPDISNFLPAFPSLHSLSLFSCEIQFEALEALLSHVPASLRELSFGGDMIGSLNVQTREEWRNTEKLGANPGVVNFVYLDRNLPHLIHLKTLDLSFNPFTSSCLYLFVKTLKSLTEKPAWEHLHLQNTYMREKDLPLLKTLVNNLPHLTTLNLEGTRFYEDNKEGAKALKLISPTLKLTRYGDD